MNRSRRLLVLTGAWLGFVVMAAGARAQAPAAPSTDPTRYAVAYVDVVPSGRDAMTAAFRKYRDASRAENGFVRAELLEQIGRPGHFIVLETWKDEMALAGHGMGEASKQFRDALQPVRASGYDQRPYKAASASPAAASATAQAIQVVSHVDIGPGGGDAVGMLARLAESSRKERGCLRFDVLQHAMRANHFTVVETWASQAALDAHTVAAHTKEYRDQLQPMSGSPLDERVLRAVE